MRIYYLQTITSTGKKYLTEDVNGKAGICTEFDSRVKVFATKRESNFVCKKLNKQVKAVFTVMG